MRNFRGTYECVLDEKGRFVLPRRFRQTMGSDIEDFVVMKGDSDRSEKCLLLYPEDRWEIKESVFSTLDDNIAENREYQRRFGARIQDVNMDAQNRITLPMSFIEHAGLQLKGALILYGQFVRIEIWNPETFHKYMEESEGTKPFNEHTVEIIRGPNVDS